MIKIRLFFALSFHSKLFLSHKLTLDQLWDRRVWSFFLSPFSNFFLFYKLLQSQSRERELKESLIF